MTKKANQPCNRITSILAPKPSPYPNQKQSASARASLMSQNLCIHCQNLSGAWLVPRFYDLRDSKYPAHEEPILWWTYASWEELEESSKSCSLCALIIQESHSVTQGPFTKGDRPGIRFQASGSSRLEVWCVEKLKRAKLNVALDSGTLFSSIGRYRNPIFHPIHNRERSLMHRL